MTNTTQRQFQKGDVVRCKLAGFTPEQQAVTPNRPVLGRLYIVRAALQNTTSKDVHNQVLLLETVHNKLYRTIYNNRECLTENGFNPVRFELVIAVEETDWAVGMAMLAISNHK